MPCASTVIAFVSSRQLSLAAMVALAFQLAISPETVGTDDSYNMELRDNDITVGEIFSVQAYCHH